MRAPETAALPAASPTAAPPLTTADLTAFMAAQRIPVSGLLAAPSPVA